MINNNKATLKIRLYKNKIFKIIIIALAIATLIPLFWVITFITYKGISSVNWEFITSAAKPPDQIGGGIIHALIGTIYVVLGASVISIPIGVFTGLYLAENRHNKFSDIVRLLSDVLQSVPSIILGIFVYLILVKTTGTFSAFSGSVALAIMMLPMIIRTTEEVIKLIPNTLKEASLALGVPYYRTLLKVVLPTAFSGILNGILIAISRVTGETAPLLFTAFGNQFINLNYFKGGMETLPHLIYIYATSPYENWINIAWGASFVLILIILFFTLGVKFLTRNKSVKL